MEIKLKAAIERLDDLLKSEKDYPFTNNPDFKDNVRRLQQKRFNRDRSAEGDVDLAVAEVVFDTMTAYYNVCLF